MTSSELTPEGAVCMLLVGLPEDQAEEELVRLADEHPGLCVRVCELLERIRDASRE